MIEKIKTGGNGTMRHPATLVTAIIAATILFAAPVGAQDVKHYRFAYDQPRNSFLGIGR